MVPAISVGGVPTVDDPKFIESKMGEPKTEGFDFMQYLLGLQVANLDPTERAGDPNVESFGTLAQNREEEEIKDPLLALLSGDKPDISPAWLTKEMGLTSEGLYLRNESRPVQIDNADAQAGSEAELLGLRTPQGPNGRGLVRLEPHDVLDRIEEPTSHSVEKVGLGKELPSQTPVRNDEAPHLRESEVSSSQGIRSYSAVGKVNGSLGSRKSIEMGEVRPETAKSASKVKADSTGPADIIDRPGPEETHVESGMMLSSTLMPSPSHSVTSNVATQDSPHSPATLPELMSQVDRLAKEGGGKMTVTLNPPELGQVEVEVVSRGKRVEIEMRSESDKVRSLLENHLTDLKQSVQSHDLVVSKLEVSWKGASASSSVDSFQLNSGGESFFRQSQGQSDKPPAPRQAALFQEGSAVRFSSLPARGVAVGANSVLGRVDLRI